MQRRDILKAIALSGAAAVIKPFGAFELLAQTKGATPDLVAALGGDPAAMLQQVLTELGGLGRFVKAGNTVVVKPNIGWDNTPEEGGNTNPELVGALVRQCLAAGAARVQVFDHTCDNWKNCYQNSGIAAAVTAAGGEMLDADDKSAYREVALPEGKKLKNALIHRAILDCDLWLNVPVLKSHGGAGVTSAMKNLMGIVWDRRTFHWKGLHQCIADLCTLQKKPALNIVDGWRILVDGGPRGGRGKQVSLSKALFASADMVAVDTAAVRFFSQLREMPLSEVGYLADGEALHLGTTRLDSLDIRRLKL